MGRAKNIAKVSGATIASRILGLVRDSATMAYLTFSAVSAAYTLAFTLPNLFRRLLGEGALSSAMVPIFSQSIKREGMDAAFAFLNKVLTRAGLLLAAICAIGILCSWLSAQCLSGAPERFYLGATFTTILIPYTFLICMAAVFSSALNVLDSFGVPSITPALHNLSIILALFAGIFFFGKDNSVALASSMCVGWLIGGVLQMGLPAYWLYRKGWRFSPDFGKSESLGELYSLFFPALMGAAVIQLNIFVSKILALFLSDAALPAIYLSERILEFPLGVFTIAIATVYFPRLSSISASGELKSYADEYKRGLTATLCISIPAMFGILSVSRDILVLLFEWGLFNSGDVDLCAPILSACILGLPFFSIATFATRGFHSRKDTRTPVKVSIYSFALNFVLALLFMNLWGAVGLVLANIAAAMLQAYMLQSGLRRAFGPLGIGGNLAKILGASLIMAAIVIAGRCVMAQFFDGKILSTLVCAILIPAGASAYFILLRLMKFDQLPQIKKLLKRI